LRETVYMAKKLGLDKVVHFLPPSDDVGAYVSSMDVFVLPSLFEGLPLVGVEAQASGLIVLSSEHVSREMDTTGNVEFLPLDSETWVQALTNTKTPTNRIVEGAKLIGSRFDIKAQSRKLFEYYERIHAESE